MATIQYKGHGKPFIGSVELWSLNNDLLRKIEDEARAAGKMTVTDDAAYRRYEVTDEQAAALLAHTKSERLQFAAFQNRSLEVVKADCGHTVEKQFLMSASRGSACPDCYDRMSN